MWVTQTYLGDVEPNAKLHIYYFFENYVPDQSDFTERVQQELERLGEVYGDEVSLLMPNQKYAGRIEAEVRENRELWSSLRGKLPGLFLSPKPLKHLNSTDDGCIYIPFEMADPHDVAAVIERVRGLADRKLWEGLQAPVQRSFRQRLVDAIEVKPGIWGISIDLKKLGGR